MDKMTFASYKFKPSDVIEGLNRYFAETKAFRYLRVPLEIKNGTVKPGNYYVFRNIVFVSMSSAPKVKELGYYYIICDPEEVVGVAINWLREEHDIFYAPPKAEGFEGKIEPLSSTFYCCDNKLVTETQRLQEENKKLKKKTAEQQKKIDSYETTLSKITDIMKPKYAGPTWSETLDDLVERIKRMKEKVETLEAENADWMDSFSKAQDSRSAFCKKLKEALNVDYRYPGSFPKMEEDILAEVTRLKEKAKANDFYVDDAAREYEKATQRDVVPVASVREALGIAEDSDIFEAIAVLKKSDERAHSEMYKARGERYELEKRLADIRQAAGMADDDTRDLVKYVGWLKDERIGWLNNYFEMKQSRDRSLELKKAAEEALTTVKESLAREREWTKRMGQKLIEIQDICER